MRDRHGHRHTTRRHAEAISIFHSDRQAARATARRHRPWAASEPKASRITRGQDLIHKRLRQGHHVHARLRGGPLMGTTILVIEDNRASLELMTYLLRAFGYHCLSAQDGREGYLLAEKHL